MTERREPGADRWVGGNLPPWPAAATVYSRAYAALERMARGGHVTRVKTWRGSDQCTPSQEMVDLVTALDGGDAETIKGILLVSRYRTATRKYRYLRRRTLR